MKYSVNELAELLSRSRPVTEKWVKRKGFKATTKLFKNREIKAYELTDSELEELRHGIEAESGYEVTNESSMQPTSHPENPGISKENNFDKLIDFTSQYVTDMKHYTERLQSASERAVYAESQIKLIETSEARKDARIRELEATIKQLEAQLEQERKKPFWKKSVL